VLKQLASHVLSNGGVVRGFENLGKNQDLPYRIRKYQTVYERASVYGMTFDAAPTMLPSLKQLLAFDEDVLRSTVIKLGDSVGKISAFVSPEKL
jgi:small subunit ribosomal protein S6